MAKNINPADYCTGSLRPRIPEDAAYMEAPGQVPVTAEIVNQLNAFGDPKVRLMEDVGIRINPDGNAEKTNNIPRMFILQQSADDPAADEVKELGSAGITFGSLAFWKEVQKGNVFCYPAGTANPVQLRLDTSVPGKPMYGYSTPIDPEEIPLREKPVADPAPTKPWALTMWLNRTLGMFKDRVNGYNNRMQAFQAYQQRRNHLLDPIRQHAEQRTSNNRLGQELQKANDKLKAIEDVYKSSHTVDIGEPYIRELYGTKPRQHVNFTRENLPEHEKAAAKYSQSEFDELKPIEIDLNSIKVGNTDVTIKEEDFTALSMFAATQYKHAKNALEGHTDEADWMINDLKAYEIENPEARRADSMNTMFTMDIVRDEKGPRENIGMFFKNVFQPAREEAGTALENYKAAASAANPEERRALKEGLGTIIAAGINCAANYVKEKPTLSHQDRLMAREASRLIRLMEQDPELRSIAEEKGMNAEKLKSVKGMAAYDQLAREKDEAMRALKTAAAYGHPLTDQQKKAYAEKILKADTFEAMFKNAHNVNTEKGDYKRLYDKLMSPENLVMPPRKKHPVTGAEIQLPWSECPPLENGRVYLGNPMQKVQSALAIEKLPEPEIAVLMSNPQGQKWLDDFTKKQVSQMNLDEMDADALDRQLEQKRNSERLIQESAASMMEFAAPKKEVPNPQKAPEPLLEKKAEPNPIPVLA